jgi:hypothetical protein
MEDEDVVDGNPGEAGGGDGGDGKPAAKPAVDVDAIAEAVGAKVLNQVTARLENARKTDAAVGSSVASKKQSEIAAAQLKTQGFSQEQIDAVFLAAKAITNDAFEEKKAESSAAKQVSLETQAWDALDDKITDHIKDIPSLKWSKQEVMTRASQILAEGKSFQSARDRWSSQKIPLEGDMASAVDMAVDEWCKDHNIGRSKPQLDTRSSRLDARAATSSTSTTMSPGQRKAYLAVKNATGNEKMAKDAAARWAAIGQ